MQIVAPVTALTLVGYIWARAGYEYPMEFVARLGMTVSTPCMVFVALMQTEVDPSALATVAVAAGLAYLALSLIWWGFVCVTKMERRTYMAVMIFGNTGNVGLPIALLGFGAEGLGYGIAIFAVSCIWSFTFGAWLMTGGSSFLKMLKEPVSIASILGGIFLWQGWHTPVWLTNSLDLLGQMAIPIMIITLGVSITRLTPSRLWRALYLSLLRNAVALVVAVSIGLLFGLGHAAFAVLVLQIASPGAVTIYMLAARHGADADAVAGIVIMSTLLSVITIPLTLAFLL